MLLVMVVDVYLYLLVFPDKGLVKIGQAVDVFARSQSFGWIGVPDYAESYRVPVSDNRINSVEKGLHRLLSIYRCADVPGKGDGHTELFRLDVLEVALEFVRLLGKYDSSVGVLMKGIEVPSLAGSIDIRLHDNKLYRGYKRLARKAGEHYADSVVVSERLRDINRLILLLYRYQYRIPFRYERQGDCLSFYICMRYIPRPNSNKFDRLWRRFGLSFVGLEFSASCAVLTSVHMPIDERASRDGMVRFEIDLSGFGALERIRHQAEFTIGLFEKLPQRSPAYEARVSQ